VCVRVRQRLSSFVPADQFLRNTVDLQPLCRWRTLQRRFLFRFLDIYRHCVGYYLENQYLLRGSGDVVPLWAPKVYYRVHKCLLLDPILRRFSPINTYTPYFSTVHAIIIILVYMPRCRPRWISG
jgi:hypothetical protein